MSEVFWQPGIKLSDNEKQIIKAAMIFYRGNKTATASALGIAIRTLDNKLAEYKEQDDELQRRAEKIKGDSDARFLAIKSNNARISNQSTNQITSEQPLPLQQRQEVQGMSPASAPRTNQNQEGHNRGSNRK